MNPESYAKKLSGFIVVLFRMRIQLILISVVAL